MSSKRDQLIDMAIELFFRQGCHTTGIDTLLAKAGVAKMTLYAHFKSKEDLILAAAERVHEDVMAQLEEIYGNDDPPREQFLRMFDTVEERVSNQDYRGYVFHQLATEFPDPEHPIHRFARKHTARIEGFLRDALIRGKVADAESLARQLMILGEGTKMLVQLTGDRDYARQARMAAIRLLDMALPQPA